MTAYLGKSCSFGFPRVPFVNCRQFMYLVISLLVLRAGCGIWLYQFLIIAYLFTFHVLLNLLDDLGKKIRCEALPSILSVFPNEFNKFNNTGAGTQDYIYYMTLKPHFISKFCTKPHDFAIRKRDVYGRQRITLQRNLHI